MSVSYLVLARKYRPQSFADLVGQEHVAQTLANAIAQNRVAHAFLFTGVRGVGKTTSARLLAKCLNCLGAGSSGSDAAGGGKATGPTATPCQVCAACTEIAAGVDMDVQEIDGASYTGIDDVRALQQGMNFRPARDRFKIYIVDEVHMLSNAAWNAFLKTLEEPPPHVKFIFATTEVHKLPVTILSRCQRYDFKLISTQVIAKRLEQVLAQEKVTADGEAIAVIAREAAGSMRDAMSLLDQVIAFSGQKLSGEDVTRVLGVADRKVLHDLASALVAGDAAAALQITGSLAQQGFDLPHVARDVLRHLRNLVVAKVSGESGRQLLDLADEEAKDVFALAQTADADDLTRLFQGFSRGFDEIVKGGQPRMAIEMLFVRLARRPPLLPVEDLIARLGELEKRLGGAPPSPSAPPRGSPSPRSQMQGGSQEGGGGPRAISMPVAPAPAPKQNGPARSPASIASPTIEASAPAPVMMGALALAREPVPSPDADSRRKPAPREVALPEPPLTEPTSHLAQDPTWRAILNRLDTEHRGIARVFEHAVPLELTPERVRLGFDENNVLSEQAKEPDAHQALTRAVRAHFGKPTEVALELTKKSQGASVASLGAKADRERSAKAHEEVAKHPLVLEAISLFSGELRDVKLPEPRE